jgi:endonuclease YncB( thermonuclease family)
MMAPMKFRIFCAVALTALLALTDAASAQERRKIYERVAGIASVIDGDTVEIHGTRIRLHGIDAPESGQTCHRSTGEPYRCGQTAALALAEFIGRKTVVCDPSPASKGRPDRYGRMIAICSVDRSTINEWMVDNGHAVSYLSKDYDLNQTKARLLRRGLWAGAFDMPSDYRKAR